MKKTVKAALFAALVCFSSTLFAAQPVSFLNGTTNALFQDETVDNFAWGVEDADGIVLGGFINGTDPKVKLGFGKYLGSLWFSVYDEGYLNNQFQIKETVKNEVHTQDGVNTDYVDVDYKVEKPDSFYASNNLYVSFAGDDWGVQTYWLTTRNNPNITGPNNINETEEDKATGYTYNHVKKTSKVGPWNNTFGAYFNGIGLFDNISFELTQFQVYWGNTYNKTKETWAKKTNGSIFGWDADDNKTEETKTATHTIMPKVVGKMGIEISDMTYFELGESFVCTIKPRKNKSKTVTVIEDATYKQTVTTTTANKYHNGFTFTDTVTPKFIFTFEPDEKIAVKASVKADVAFSNGYGNDNWTRTTETTTVTEYKYKPTKTTENSKKVELRDDGTLQLISKSFTTSITPAVDLGIVYQVKPEKFNLNFGVEWLPSSFSWTISTNKNTTVKVSDYATKTDEAGETIVTKNTVEYKKANATNETRTNTFSFGGNNDVKLQIGASWFMTQKVQMDIAYTNAFTSIKLMGTDPSLTESALKLMFSVKF